jgi:hypothetical protein
VIELAHPVHELVDTVELGAGADAVLLVAAASRVETGKTIALLKSKL